MVSKSIGSDVCAQTRNFAILCKNCKQSRYPFPAAYSQCCGSGQGKGISVLLGSYPSLKSFFIFSNTHSKSAQSPHVNANSYIRQYASLLIGICTSSYKNLTQRKCSVCFFRVRSIQQSGKLGSNVSRYPCTHNFQMSPEKSSGIGNV